MNFLVNRPDIFHLKVTATAMAPEDTEVTLVDFPPLGNPERDTELWKDDDWLAEFRCDQWDSQCETLEEHPVTTGSQSGDSMRNVLLGIVESSEKSPSVVVHGQSGASVTGHDDVSFIIVIVVVILKSTRLLI